MGWILIAILVGLGAPMGIAVGVGGFVLLSSEGLSALEMSHIMLTGIMPFIFMAIPLFLFLGTVMEASGITGRLLELADLLVGHLRGGLGHVVCVTSLLFSGMTGSAYADIAVVSRILAPEMIRRGYGGAFSGALITTSSLAAPLIPPSIGLIIYGVGSGASIGELFIAGIIPGVMLICMCMVVLAIEAHIRGYTPSRAHPGSPKEITKSLFVNGPALLLPVLIIGGIRTGLGTPTEMAAVAILYAILVGVLFYKGFRARELRGMVYITLAQCGAVMLLLAAAAPIGWILAYKGIVRHIIIFAQTLTTDPQIFLFLVDILLLVLGMFFEGTVMNVLLVPILAPIAETMGIDLVHFGIVFLLCILIGGLTPPFGPFVFICSSIIGVPSTSIFKELMPFFAGLLVLLAIITYVPECSLWLPSIF